MKNKNLILKTIILFLVFVSPCTFLSGQINQFHNSPRSGDKIIKKQFDYIEPGEAGEDKLWDLSLLAKGGNEYVQEYTEPLLIGDSIYIMGPDTFLKRNIASGELIIGIENYTVYYYRIRDGRITLLGFENPVTEMHYQTPLLQMNYPFSYGDRDSTLFETKGLYSREFQLETNGEEYIEADASGRILLPSGDTLSNVLRVKTIQNVRDSLSMNTTQVSYRWYARGYRYPVLETLRSVNNMEEGEIEIFKTTFFYPPEEHLYLEDDLANQVVNTPDEKEDKISPGVMSPLSGYSINGFGWGCNIYPTPVETWLNVEYMLEKDAVVSVSLYDMAGKLLHLSPGQQQLSGYHIESVNCQHLSTGNYVLHMSVGDEEKNRIIIKK